MNVSVVYPSSKVVSGYLNYSTRLIKGLIQEGVSVKTYPIRKLELSIFGKPIFGTISQSFFSKLIRPVGGIVHSLTPNVIVRNTNIVTVHDLLPLELEKKFSSSLYRRKGNKIIIDNILKVQHLIVFSDLMKHDVIELLGISGDRIHVVNQSIDHSQFYPEADDTIRSVGKHLVIAVGDLNPRKRYDILFRALGGLSDIELVHIGSVNAWNERNEELKKIKSEFNNIRMIGEVDGATLRKYMSTADLLVHLSEGEGFGLTPIEAMACGTNVVVSDLPIFRETLAQKAFFCKLVESDVRKAVEKAIKFPIGSNELIKYTEKFSLYKMAKDTINVYDKIVEEQ